MTLWVLGLNHQTAPVELRERAAFAGEALTQAQVLYSLWLGANLQAKISRSAVPLESALAHVNSSITAPGV